MELTMDAQDDPTPWSLPANPTPAAPEVAAALLDVGLPGRGYFSELGVVRRKPARPDAPPTLSKSCTDKIALKQSTSLLNAAASLLLDPRNAYLSTLVLPESQHVPAATTRAFSSTGRMASLVHDKTNAWPSGYLFRPFQVHTASREFEWSRRSGQPGQTLIPCNLSALYTPQRQEVIINGSLQGRKQGDVKGASAVSRRAMWSAVAGVVRQLEHDACPEISQLVGTIAESREYASLKQSPLLLERQQVKDIAKRNALCGWVKNVADDSFNID
ncbi:Adenosine deaminase/editase [Macrophomina phaseolina MS6]|uniref:Adenosine deaminase/editase n=1 Tax=Macrophomina phaseolina (strain MS6) TaxID=1126212 RepID=K2S428_MACPH|nr:Adenosine deaminase/editase [Macrophomina phaseolina MS6]